MKPAYEIVQAFELRMGDIVTIEPDLDPWVMDDVRLTDSHLFYRGDGQGTEFSMPRDRWIYRLLPPERNPDVLIRALKIAFLEVVYDGNPSGAIKHWINHAIKELESEAGDGGVS